MFICTFSFWGETRQSHYFDKTRNSGDKLALLVCCELSLALHDAL